MKPNEITKCIGLHLYKPATAIPDHIMLKCEKDRLIKTPWAWYKVIDAELSGEDGGEYLDLANGRVND